MGFWENVGNAIMAIATLLSGTREVCYDGIGCFSNDTPFTNAGGRLPQDPANMTIQFLLYTRDNRLIAQTLTNNREMLSSSYYDRTKNTKFIIHGFRDNSRGWVVDMATAILDKVGLDPAGLYFEQQDLRVRLDPDDALFVDAIHTDGEAITELGFGSRISVGDVDFYPNGGSDQPGCTRRKRNLADMFRNGFSAITGNIGCSHGRAHQLFKESISDTCYFMASPCTSYEYYLAGSCPCTSSNCVTMGYHVDTNIPHGDYYLSTNAAEPYCMSK